MLSKRICILLRARYIYCTLDSLLYFVNFYDAVMAIFATIPNLLNSAYME